MKGLFCLLLFVSTSSTFARQYRGTCRDNTLIDVFNTDLLDQCKDNCRDDDNCVALTFNLELKVCQTFSFCNRFTNGRCPTCITVFKEEFVPEICNFHGICQVSFCLNCEQHELAACLLVTFLTFRDDGYKRWIDHRCVAMKHAKRIRNAYITPMIKTVVVICSQVVNRNPRKIVPSML